MLPYFTNQYGNPHSRTHMYGWEAEDAVENARKQVSRVPCWGHRQGIWQCSKTSLLWVLVCICGDKKSRCVCTCCETA